VNKRKLYEKIMGTVAKEVKKYLNENNIQLLTDLEDTADDTADPLTTKNVNTLKSADPIMHIKKFKYAVNNIKNIDSI
jgi:hypothetical protein